MAEPQRSSVSASFTGVIAVLLLAAGVIVNQIPLERSRPVTTERVSEVLPDRQTVPARLWQDPISAVQKDWTNLLNSGAAGEKEFNGKRDKLRRDIETSLSAGTQVTLLAVTVFGGGYAETVESRRRNRYAVLSGLNALRMRPDNEEHIDYLPAEQFVRGRSPRIPYVIPYEWFVQIDAAGPSPGTRREVLVLWFDSMAMGSKPLAYFQQLFAGVGKTAGHLLQSKLIIASGTDTLASVITELQSQPQNNIGVYAATATISNRYLPQAAPGGNGADPRLLRTGGTDDGLARTLLQELERRNVRLDCTRSSAAAHPDRREDHVLLVAEWDTRYSRALKETFRSVLCGDCETRGNPEECLARLHIASYMRGLDGEIPNEAGRIDAPTKGTGDAPGGGAAEKESKKPDVGFISTADKERAEGNSQFDYLRRLNSKIASLTARIKSGEIKAIGVLGSDYYDKALILQALQKNFPRAVFFTTDLDARLLQGDQYAWTHNLVVASHFGLSLNPALQRDVLPFRDSYQTATFFTTQLALDARCQGKLDQAALNRLLEKPRLYEIGRTGLIRLAEQTTETLNWNCASAASTPNATQAVASLHPADFHLDQIRAFFRVNLLVGAGLLMLLFYFSTRTYDALWQHPVFAVLVAGALAGVVCAFNTYILESADEEPLYFFEGVSAWPSQLLRVLAMVTAVYFALRAHLDIRLSDRKLTEDFFAETPGAFQYVWRRPGEKAIPMLWRHLRALFAPWRFQITERTHAAGQGHLVNARDLWADYLALGTPTFRYMRAFIGAMAFVIIAETVVGPEVLEGPLRGPLSTAVNFWISHVGTCAYLFLVFYVADGVRICRSYVRHLNRAKTGWPATTIAMFTLAPSELAPSVAPADHYLRDYIDMRMIAERTEVVSRMIYYPFVVLFLTMVARSPIFDNWEWTPGFLAMIGASALIIVWAAYLLRLAAEEARHLALRRLNARLLVAKGNAAEKPIADCLVHAIDAVHHVDEGAYRPFSQQQVVRAILIPFGGYGGLALIEYLVLGKV